MTEVVKDAAGNIEKVKVEAIPNYSEKVQGVIQWIAKEHSHPCTINLYNELMTVENVAEQAKKENKEWTDYFN